MTESVDLDLSLPHLKNKAVDRIIYILDSYPSDWKWDDSRRRYIKHPSGLAIWVSSGCAHIYKPVEINLGVINWFKLRRAFKRWKKRKGNAQHAATEERALKGILKDLAAFHFADN